MNDILQKNINKKDTKINYMNYECVSGKYTFDTLNNLIE